MGLALREALLDYQKFVIFQPRRQLRKFIVVMENAGISIRRRSVRKSGNASNEIAGHGRSDPKKAPDTPEQVSVTVKAGEVVAINGKAQSPYECLATLNTLGVKHGIGRIDIVENRLVGMKFFAVL